MRLKAQFIAIAIAAFPACSGELTGLETTQDDGTYVLDANESDKHAEFDTGFSGWTPSPQTVGGTTEGWVIVGNDGEQAARNSPTGTRYTYYWRLSKRIDLSTYTSPELEVKAHFKGHNYSHYRILVGPEEAGRITDFDMLYEQTEGSEEPKITSLDLSAHVGQIVTLRIELKKPYGLTENKIGLYIHRIVLKERTGDPRSLRVGAFNIQVFGRTKMATDAVPQVLVKILSRYDLVLIQEIRDSSETAILELLEELNESTHDPYAMQISDRLGRTSSKEQYAFFYRPSQLSVRDAYHYDDSLGEDGDTFEREPYVVQFQSTRPPFTDFAVVPLHSAPDHAVEELTAMTTVFSDVQRRLNEPDTILLGDFNASCNYVSDSKLASLPMKRDLSFSWWIDHDADTTTRSTHCAYDHIVTTGEITGRVVADSAQVYYFDQALDLPEDLTLKVSDHYPVELQLRID